MALVDLVMPKLGESIMEATILKWVKNAGDSVKQDETILEIATDKVDSEVPSTADGVIEETLFNVNDVVPIGAVIAKIRTSADVVDQYTSSVSESANNGNGFVRQEEELETAAISTTVSKGGAIAGNRFYSP